MVASKGHLRDLPKSKMGVDIENNYEPHYISSRAQIRPAPHLLAPGPG